MKKVLFCFLCLYCFFYFSQAAVGVKPIREVTLFQDDKIIISSPRASIVTEDGLVFLFDLKASDIKIFDVKTGGLIKVFGRNGLGPDEFVKPLLSAYSAPYLLIGDYGRRTVFIYKRDSRDVLKFSSKFFCPDMADNIHFINENELLFCGYKNTEDRKGYDIYEYHFKKNQYKYILQTELAYGYKSFKVFLEEAREKFAFIGLEKYCDVSKDNIYVVWTGDVTKIVRINRKTNGYTYFGKKTANYVQPYITPEIKKAYRERQHLVLYVLTQSMSMIRGVFITKAGNVCLVYVGPLVKDKGLQVMLQFYSKTGVFLKELQLKHSKASSQFDINFYLNRDKNLLYVIDAEDTKNFDQY